MPQRRVLLVDSNDDRANSHLSRLRGDGFDARAVPSDHNALMQLDDFRPEVVVMDLTQDRNRALGLLERAKGRFPESAFIGLTPEGSARDVTEATASGADVVVPIAADPGQLRALVDKALEKASASQDAVNFRHRAETILSSSQFNSIVGSHPSIQALLKKVVQVAATRASVLISGESGTGKELIAAAIHQNSKRAAGPLVRLNCAALADSVLESELFGHEKGAFTGAMARREGRFKQADGGTLFLDEISEISPSIQVKLLRFLQEREFERVGGNETVRVDVRIVAATNKNLRALIDDGRFREDLYYRLNVVRLEVPPLRARPSDILPLAEHFMKKAGEENEIQVLGFTEAAQKALLAYPWPGNVRELQNAVEQAVVFHEAGWVGATDLPIAIEPEPRDSLKLMIPGATLAEIERFAITETLKAMGGSTARAAEVLGISRRTVQYRVKEWRLSSEADGLDSTAGAPSPAPESPPTATAEDQPEVTPTDSALSDRAK